MDAYTWLAIGIVAWGIGFTVLYCLLDFATTTRRQIHRHYYPDGTSKDIS